MLEEGTKVAVFGNIGQKLEGHQDILIARHGCQDPLGCGRGSVAVVESVRAGNKSGRVGVVGGSSG